MKKPKVLSVFSAALLLPVPLPADDAIYRSVDKAGRVTYSAEPPPGAAKVERVELPAGPTEAAVEQSLQRAKQMEQAADAQSKAMLERRKEADAQKAAQAQAEAAESSGRNDESPEGADSQPMYYAPWYQGYWGRPHPPHPPRPPHPPQPPRPPRQGPR
jgi:hypothetical protein